MLYRKTSAPPAIERANVAYAEAIAQQRTSPGVLLFTHKRELLYTVFSQGESLEELEENSRDAYRLMVKEEVLITRPGLKSKEITVDVT